MSYIFEVLNLMLVTSNLHRFSPLLNPSTMVALMAPVTKRFPVFPIELDLFRLARVINGLVTVLEILDQKPVSKQLFLNDSKHIHFVHISIDRSIVVAQRI